MAALGGGCIFSPDIDDDPPKPKPPVVYPARNTPKGAVLYLTVAWTNRDSVRVDSVYADDYEGTSVDLTDPDATSFTFLKSDEVHSVGGIAQASDVTYTNMDLYHPSTWAEDHYVTDPPDWRTVQVPSFKIELHYFDRDGFSASPKAGETWIFEFTLRPTYPAWANGAPVWEIVKWVESRTEN